MTETVKHQLNWRGMDIEIDYCESYSKAFEETYGYPLAHVQLRSEFPLPVTQTGYCSKFIPDPNRDIGNELLKDIETWLEEETLK